jgi:hypothetical protein
MIIVVPVLGHEREYYGNHREYPHGKYVVRTVLDLDKEKKKMKITHNEIDPDYNISWRSLAFYG